MCFIEFYLSSDDLFFLEFTKNGEIISDFKFKNLYYNLYQYNGNVYLNSKVYNYCINLTNNLSSRLLLSKNKDVLYDDKNLTMNQIDFGEWGTSIWVFDKNTKKEYNLRSNAFIVNNIKNSYYLTSSFNVDKIDSIKNLEICDNHNLYRRYKNRDIVYECIHIRGLNCIYQDSSLNLLSNKIPETKILTSFVYSDILYCLVVNKTCLFIAQIIEKKLVPIKILLNISDFDKTYWLNPNVKEKVDYQTIGFNITTDLKGFIEINNNNIKIIYLKFLTNKTNCKLHKIKSFSKNNKLFEKK